MKRLRDLLHRAVVPALAIVSAFLLGAILIVLTDFDHLQHIGTDPIGAIGGAVGLVLQGYGAMFSGAIGDPSRIVAAIQHGTASEIGSAIRPLTETLLGSTPFIFGGLALAVSFRAGLFNFGIDGQFLIGGLGATVTAILLEGHLPSLLILVAALVAGAAFGAAYGFVPGILKARTGAHEVITTLMLNTIAAQIVLYVFRSGAFSKILTPIADIPHIFDLPTVRLDWGFVVALVATVVVSFLLFRTTLGFELRASGFSGTAARGVGMRPGRTTVIALMLSGGLAGLGSALVILGPVGAFTPPGDLGFVAIALALLGGLRPSGVLLAALFYGALNNGAKTMGIETGLPLALLVVIVALAMMFVAAPSLTRSMWRLKPTGLAPRDTTIDPLVPPRPPEVISPV